MALFRAIADPAQPAHNTRMSSPLLLSNVEAPGLPAVLPLPPADVCAAEAFDDETFAMNVTVDEAAAASSCEIVVDCDWWAWAC